MYNKSKCFDIRCFLYRIHGTNGIIVCKWERENMNIRLFSYVLLLLIQSFYISARSYTTPLDLCNEFKKEYTQSEKIDFFALGDPKVLERVVNKLLKESGSFDVEQEKFFKKFAAGLLIKLTYNLMQINYNKLGLAALGYLFMTHEKALVGDGIFTKRAIKSSYDENAKVLTVIKDYIKNIDSKSADKYLDILTPMNNITIGIQQLLKNPLSGHPILHDLPLDTPAIEARNKKLFQSTLKLAQKYAAAAVVPACNQIENYVKMVNDRSERILKIIKSFGGDKALSKQSPEIKHDFTKKFIDTVFINDQLSIFQKDLKNQLNRLEKIYKDNPAVEKIGDEIIIYRTNI